MAYSAMRSAATTRAVIRHRRRVKHGMVKDPIRLSIAVVSGIVALAQTCVTEGRMGIIELF